MELQNGFCLGFACAVDFFEDDGAAGFPAVRDRLEVVMGEVDVDRGDKLGDAGETALAHDIIGELAEETFDEI